MDSFARSNNGVNSNNLSITDYNLSMVRIWRLNGQVNIPEWFIENVLLHNFSLRCS